MKATKLLSLLLALLMVCSLVLVACSGDGDEKKTTGGNEIVQTTEEVDPNDVWDLEAHNLQGHEFLFLVKTAAAAHLARNEVYAEELTNDTVNDAVYRRNAVLEQKYNCSIRQDTTATFWDTAREPLMAGEYTYDVFYSNFTTAMASSNLFVDLNTLENLQFDKNWWDQNLRKGLTVAGACYFANGDASTSDERACQVIYFNRDLLERNNLEDPYELVKSGNWTIDKMYEMSEACIHDENGDGVYVPGEDIFAYICPGTNNWVHVAACGVTLSSVSSDGDIYMAGALSNDLQDVWDELKPLLTSPHRDVSDAGSRFTSGKAAFYSMNLAAILTMGDTTVNFGVIPFPKRNAEQEEYYTVQEAAISSSYFIPITVDKISEAQAAGFESGREMVGYFLNAMSYESRDTLIPAFYEQVVKRQMVQNQETADMVDLAVKNKVIDPVVFYDFGTMQKIFRDAGCGDGYGGTGGNKNGAVGSDAKYDTLTSLYEQRLSAARTALNNYITAVEGNNNPAES